MKEGTAMNESQLGESFKQKKEVVRDDLKQVRDDLHDVVQDVSKLGRATKDIGMEKLGELQGYLKTVEHQVGGYVQKNPVRVLLAALGVGFIVGLLRRGSR